MSDVELHGSFLRAHGKLRVTITCADPSVEDSVVRDDVHRFLAVQGRPWVADLEFPGGVIVTISRDTCSHLSLALEELSRTLHSAAKRVAVGAVTPRQDRDT